MYRISWVEVVEGVERHEVRHNLPHSAARELYAQLHQRGLHASIRKESQVSSRARGMKRIPVSEEFRKLFAPGQSFPMLPRMFFRVKCQSRNNRDSWHKTLNNRNIGAECIETLYTANGLAYEQVWDVWGDPADLEEISAPISRPQAILDAWYPVSPGRNGKLVGLRTEETLAVRESQPAFIEQTEASVAESRKIGNGKPERIGNDQSTSEYTPPMPRVFSLPGEDF
jgi:hypothetical protein